MDILLDTFCEALRRLINVLSSTSPHIGGGGWIGDECFKDPLLENATDCLLSFASEICVYLFKNVFCFPKVTERNTVVQISLVAESPQ